MFLRYTIFFNIVNFHSTMIRSQGLLIEQLQGSESEIVDCRHISQFESLVLTVLDYNQPNNLDSLPVTVHVHASFLGRRRSLKEASL